MAEQKVIVRIRVRRDSEANWTKTDPILRLGELGLEVESGRLKIGDGAHKWTELPYATLTTEEITEIRNGLAELPNKADKVHTHKPADIVGVLDISQIPSLTWSKFTEQIPSSLLPAYVDDLEEYETKLDFPDIGESDKLYVSKTTNLVYRWSGSDYVEISPSVALGTTHETAYFGDLGQKAYEHSQVKNANPHGVTKEMVGLGNVDNKSFEDIQGEIKGQVARAREGLQTAISNTKEELEDKIESDVAAAKKSLEDKITSETGKLSSSIEELGEEFDSKLSSAREEISEEIESAVSEEAERAERRLGEVGEGFQKTIDSTKKELEDKIDSIKPTEVEIVGDTIVEYTHMLSDDISDIEQYKDAISLIAQYTYDRFHLLFPPKDLKEDTFASNIRFVADADYNQEKFIIFPGGIEPYSKSTENKLYIHLFIDGIRFVQRNDTFRCQIFKDNEVYDEVFGDTLFVNGGIFNKEWEIPTGDEDDYFPVVTCNTAFNTPQTLYSFKIGNHYFFIAPWLSTNGSVVTPKRVPVNLFTNKKEIPPLYFVKDAEVLTLYNSKSSYLWFQGGANTSSSGGSYVKAAQGTIQSTIGSQMFNIKYSEDLQLVILSQSDPSVPLSISSVHPFEDNQIEVSFKLPQTNTNYSIDVVLLGIITGGI